MSTLEVFKAIQASEFSRFVGGQDHLFGAVFQLIHIVGLILVLSSVILVSLRLITVGEFAHQSLIRLSDATAHLIWLGLGLLAFSGFFIFSVFPISLMNVSLLLALSVVTNPTFSEIPNSSIVEQNNSDIFFPVWPCISFIPIKYD